MCEPAGCLNGNGVDLLGTILMVKLLETLLTGNLMCSIILFIMLQNLKYFVSIVNISLQQRQRRQCLSISYGIVFGSITSRF